MRWLAGVMMAASAGALSAQVVTEPARTIIFFDWSKPELNRDATAALDKVAAAYRQDPAGRFRIMGHTDRSGSAAVNRRSGLVRARSVAAYLAERGVPRGVIMIESHGEERPIVATEDGVREVQNRRVEILVAR